MGSDLSADATVQHDALGRAQVRVELRGVVDLGTHQQLRSALEQALAVPDVSAVVADMAELTLIDSTGIAVLMSAYRAGAAAGVAVRVARAHGMVDRVLRITGVLDVLGGTVAGGSAG